MVFLVTENFEAVSSFLGSTFLPLFEKKSCQGLSERLPRSFKWANTRFQWSFWPTGQPTVQWKLLPL